MSSLMVAQHNAAGTTGNHHSLPHLDILQRLGSLVTTLDMVDRDPCSRVGLFWYYILNTKQTNLDWRKPAPKNYIYTIWLEILVGVLQNAAFSYTILHPGFIPNKGKPQNWKPGNLPFATHPDRLNVGIMGNFEVFFFLLKMKTLDVFQD